MLNYHIDASRLLVIHQNFDVLVLGISYLISTFYSIPPVFDNLLINYY